MNVIRADCAGACYGVQRALDLTMKLARGDESVQTYGPLIHNPQVVDQLSMMGVEVVDRPEKISAQNIVVRSHGVTPAVMRELEASGAQVEDATCPHVIRAQRAAEKLANEYGHVIVVGEHNHPEVEGLVAYAREAGADVTVVGSALDIPDDLNCDVGVVVQTTQPRTKLDEVIVALSERGLHAHVKDTICNATNERQQAAAELAGKVDAMVVVGGHNSSNTSRLYEICKRIAPDAYHVETPEELQKERFADCVTVGVTAGASTPESQIREIEALLESW